VTIEVTRQGSDARRLEIDERTIDGRAAICILYPDERIIYRDRGRRGNWSTNTSTDDQCQEGGGGIRRMLGQRRIEVRSDGSGVEAWADVRILVPAGHDLKVKNVVGDVDISDVNGSLNIDVASSGVTSRGTRGDLNIDTGSGDVTVNGHRGDVNVDVGSGTVQLDNVDGTRVSVDAGSGGLRGSNITADDFSLDTGSGSIDFGRVTTRRMKVDSGSGSARLALMSSVESLDVETGSGSVTLAVPASFGAEFDVSTGSGGIETEFPLQVTGARRNALRGRIGNGRGRVVIETGSGRVRLTRGEGEREGERRR
jgi:DUF4097 and DUF4098 domain-containing protein YvlB